MSWFTISGLPGSCEDRMAFKKIALRLCRSESSQSDFRRHMNITPPEYRKHAYSSRLRAHESAQEDLFANYASWLAGGVLVKIMRAITQVVDSR